VRVLYLSHFGGLGGAERSLLELMVAVRRLGIDPLLLCPAGRLSQLAAQAGVAVATWSARRLQRRGPWRTWSGALPDMLRAWVELRRGVARFRPEIVHANTAQAMLWSGPVACLHGCPVVWHWRDFGDLGRIFRWMARGADAVIAISEAVFEHAADLLGGAAPPLVLVRNGIADLPAEDAAGAASLRRALHIPAQAPLVVMAGQSVPRKGHAVLLEAMARLASARPDLRAWLICAEHDAEAAAHTRGLRRLAMDLGCAGTVRITGGVEDIAPVLRAADVVAVPSLREPFGRIAAEAMLAERPVVASAVDGLREIIDPGQSGLLVPPGDAGCLAAGLRRLLEEPALRLSAGEGRRRALELFSVARVAEQVVSLYRSLRRRRPRLGWSMPGV
jgi:glycosyltransferase involved in cell wall biosynthesis